MGATPAEPTGPTRPTRIAWYRDRAARCRLDEEAAARPTGTISNLRLLAVALALVLLAVAVFARLPWLGVPIVLLLLAFAALVIWHRRLLRRLHRARALASIQREALARLARDWDAMPPAPPVVAPPDHPYARDLDIDGPASLLQLLNTTTSPMGEACLSAWLLSPAPAAQVRERQAAVRELSEQIEICQAIEAAGREAREAAGGTAPDPAPFVTWAEEAPPGRPVLQWLAVLSPVLFLGTLLLWVLRVLPWPIWGAFFATNVVLAGALGPGAARTLGAVRLQESRIGPYGVQLSRFQAREWTSPLLQRLATAARSGAQPAEGRLRALSRIASFSIPPSSLLHWPMLVVFLWNVHLAALADRWRRRDGGRVRSWLGALGEIEALACLGALWHREPDWTLPELALDVPAIAAQRLGHPLLDPGVRVDNDVRLGPPGRLLLVTGSNMSGKSTLLRAIGVNAVLAAAGGPVCAHALRLPQLRLWTSMRIDDSLARGVSYFLAELQRLKAVVDGIETAARGEDLGCYLLDEILQGTNTAERTAAARAVLRHLAAQRAIGAVSTHDLALAGEPGLQPSLENVHLQETIGSGPDGTTTMTFDYRLRDGVATSSNALRLLSAIGLPSEE